MCQKDVQTPTRVALEEVDDEVVESPRRDEQEESNRFREQQQQQQRDPSSDADGDNAPRGKRRGGRLLDRLRRHPIFSPSLVLENSGSVARDHLAAERTFLAYVRTSLGCAAAGVGSYPVYLIVLPKAYSLFTCSSCTAISNDTYRRLQTSRGIR